MLITRCYGDSSLIDDTDVVLSLLHASGVRLALSLSPYAAAGAAGLADPCLMRVQYTHASHPSHLLLPGPSKHLKYHLVKRQSGEKVLAGVITV
jgi:hypothetical protein